MTKYLLEFENWIDWELVSAFTSFDRAKAHGLENFPQNKWRIVLPGNAKVVYEHDPFGVIAAEAALEIKRFEDTERWRQVFADRAASEIRRQQEAERLAEQRARQRARFARAGSYLDPYSEFWDYPRNNPLNERVNWIKEGF